MTPEVDACPPSSRYLACSKLIEVHPAQPKIRQYFIDESGNTGDATRTGTGFDFDRQPIFVLACLGIEDEQAFAATFATLKARHRLLAAEVKSDAAWKKPGFYLDLLGRVDKEDSQIT